MSKFLINNPSFLYAAGNINRGGADSPFYLQAIDDDTTVTFEAPALTEVSDNGIVYSQAPETMTINSGEKLYIKILTISDYDDLPDDNFYSVDKRHNIGGDCLCENIDIEFDGESMSGYVFHLNKNNVVDASKLIIDISRYELLIYPQLLFDGCTSLVNAPELPATTLVDSCYAGMFSGCTSLVNVPELPATNLADNCYAGMFSGCTSLVNAPELPATTLADSCYEGMFSGCTSLVNAPELPATTLADSCYAEMFDGCTLLVTAIELPATILKSNCYRSMFSNCNSLNYLKCLANTESDPNPSQNCTYAWLVSVSSVGVFVKSAGTIWERSENGIPEGWTVEEYAG